MSEKPWQTYFVFWKHACIALAVFFVALFATSCSQKPEEKPPDVDFYTCTMHPSVRKQHPNDKCPICGMDLVPVLKKDAGTNHAVAASSDAPSQFFIAPERLQQIGVTRETVKRQHLHRSIRTAGTVAYDARKHWEYVARVDGYIKELFVFSRGERLERGAPILTIYSPDLFTTEREFIDALAISGGSGSDAATNSTGQLLKSARERLRLWNISDQQIAELEKTRKPSETLTLDSPFAGVVRSISAAQGGKIAKGDSLVDLVDLSTVWVWAWFYEDDFPLLKPGMPVTISSKSLCGEKLRGTISLVDPFVDPALRTGRVRIDLENPESKLQPDMYVDVELLVDGGEAVAIPASAVLPTGEHNIVFVDKGGGNLEPRYVELGGKFGEFYAVKSGVAEGEQVITSANFLIDAEAKVQRALKSF
jgi:multidrug efflux pump subunit AcrA (membrane-fusion protein)